MKLKADVPEIDQADPFKSCKLNRGKIGERLKKFISFTDGGFVMSINNKWGAGKTTFIKMWAQLMANDDYKTIYLNAWENDFYDDPLIPLLGEMQHDLKSDKFDSLVEKAAQFGSSVLPAVVKAIAKKAGVTEELIDVFHDATKGASKILTEEVKNFQKKKNGLIAFRNKLKEIVSEKCGNKPLIIIIDELDRCRPDYAVELLEKIKHLFAVNNIVFVLCIDKEQLGYAIQGRYGSSNIDTEEYLRRFINYEFTLPAPNIEDYFDYLFIQTFGGTVKRPNANWITRFKDFPIITLMTLRQLESFFFILGNCNNILGSRDEYTAYSLLTIISLKVLKNSDYNNIKNLNYSVEEFQKKIAGLFLLSGRTFNKVEANHILNIEAILCIYYTQKRNKIEIYENILIDKQPVDVFMPVQSAIISDQVSELREGRYNEILNNYIQHNKTKIDFLEIIEDLADVQLSTNPVEVTVEKM